MSISTAARLLSVLGRLVALTTAALAAAFMAWLGYDMVRYAIFSENPTWGEVGVLPFVIVLRIVAAGWVARGALKLDVRAFSASCWWPTSARSWHCTAGTSRSWVQPAG